MSDAVTAPTVLTPHALPMFRDLDPGRGSKRKRDKERQDPRKSRRPELPVTGPGKGGRVGASATQHIVQNLVRDTTRDVDVSLSGHNCPPILNDPFPSHGKPCSSMRMLQKRIRNGRLVSFLSSLSFRRRSTCHHRFYLHIFTLLTWLFFLQPGKSTNRSLCLHQKQKWRKQSRSVQSI